ncbi:MAG: hypothetical protein GPOALKHO_000435 [Sodalis sp.]|uniref:hypothetical protein n=1 Tax=Sodalis sp. (in: enterobacteria) TaxID=1898979 RepID=UPI0038738208|nr:MAG: hypothetical protein GPOALKHO_000435 [Sodalis sp.]
MAISNEAMLLFSLKFGNYRSQYLAQIARDAPVISADSTIISPERPAKYTAFGEHQIKVYSIDTPS